MKDAQSSARRTRAGDIHRAGRLSVYELFAAQASRDPHAIAIEAGRRAAILWRARCARRASRRRARRQGRAPGRSVALLSENRAEYIELELAAAYLGAIVACQNWRLAAGDCSIASIWFRRRLLIASRALRSARRGARSATAPKASLSRRPRDADAERARRSPRGRRSIRKIGLVILYTSGTTGLPKGALISHRAEIARMALLRMDMRRHRGGRLSRLGADVPYGLDRPDARRIDVRRHGVLWSTASMPRRSSASWSARCSAGCC